MSHFTVMVVTKGGTDAEIEKALAPFHEFECTGHNDEYVQNVNETQEARETYEKDTERRYKAPNGALHYPYGDEFYREFTPEETAKHGPVLGTGFVGGDSWCSKDWGDGRGYRAKMHFIPEGWEDIEVPTKDVKTFAQFVNDYYDRKIVWEGETPDTDETHKYGWVRLNAAGDVVEVVDRTNPNKKWDWWVVGGRYSNHFALKKGGKGDSARKSAVDFEAMRVADGIKAGQRWEVVRGTVGNLTGYEPWKVVLEKHPDSVENARKEYHAQPQVQALRGNRDLIWDSLDNFLCTKAEYVAKAEREAVMTFAFLRDGQWAERGKMGWWATVSDENAEWDEAFEKLLADVPDDYFLTVVDCHI